MNLAPTDDRPLLLDGGTGQELLARATADPTPLWSARVMIDEPELVVDVHRAYLAAGARAITTNAYSATRCRLVGFDLEHEYERLQRLAVELAHEARGDREDVIVAGCLSPYRWTYHPELAPPFDELWPTYAESAALQADGVDVFLCETMGSIDEARSAAVGAATTGRPVWIGWTIADDDSSTLRSGEPVADAVAAAASWVADGIADVRAVLLNCSTPEALSAAMPDLAEGDLAFGGYANGFHHITEEYDPDATTTLLGTREEVDPVRYADTVESWLDIGATVVGGCCEIGPDHIAEIGSRLDRRGRASAS